MSLLGSLAGAGLGYGIDKLSGGKGKYGAIAGGLAGGLFGGGFNMNDGGVGFNMDDSLAGQGIDYANGLLGSPKQNAEQLAYNKEYMSIPDSYMTPAVEKSLSEGYNNLATPSTGLFDTVSNLGGKYKDTIDLGMDAFNTYGDYQTQQDTRKKNEAEYNYINDMRRRANVEQAYMTNARNQAQSNIGAGYQGSSLSNYYTT